VSASVPAAAIIETQAFGGTATAAIVTCPTAPHGFTDVPASSFAAADIACIKALGITTGTSPTTYSPDDSVTREQMAAFIGRLIRANVHG
jgi:hypothetical protein